MLLFDVDKIKYEKKNQELFYLYIIYLKEVIHSPESKMVILSIFSYPFDVTTSPNFELAYIFIAWGGFISIFGIPTVDGSFIELNVHLAGQFKIVQTELNYMIANEIGNFSTLTKKIFKIKNNLYRR